MSASALSIDSHKRFKLIELNLLAGLSLLPLLGLGMFSGIHSTAFHAGFFLHAILLIAAVITTALFILKLTLDSGRSGVLPAVVMFLALVVVALFGTLPITGRDALIHHLAVPKLWVQAGYITEITWHEWSYYPMLIQLGFTGLLEFGLDRWTSYYHALWGVLLLGATAALTLSRSRDPQQAMISLAVLAGIPVVLRLASCPLVDLGLALYYVLAVHAFLIWVYDGRILKHLVFTGLALGLAIDCKYNGLLACALFFPLILIYGAEISWASRCKACIVCGIFLLLAWTPWMLRNISLTGNPIFPLYKSYFQPRTLATSSQVARTSFSPIELRRLMYGESSAEILALPLRMLFTGRDEDPRKFDGVLSPLLLLPLLLVPLLKKRADQRFIFLNILLYFGLALVLAGARVRYLAPLYGPFAALSALAIGSISADGKRLGILSVLVSLFSLVWIVIWAWPMQQRLGLIDYLHTDQSDSQYLRKQIPEYGMIQRINSDLPVASKIYLLLTGNQFYYYDREVISGGHNSESLLINLLQKSSQAPQVRAEFQKQGVTHIMLHTLRTKELLEGASLTNDQRILWNNFSSQHMQLVTNDQFYSLWKLK